MKITFQEMALRGKEILSRQGPVTLEQAREQVERLKKNSKCSIAQGLSASALQAVDLGSSPSGATQKEL